MSEFAPKTNISVKRIITGIRPTATLTIANLIGAAVPLLELQNTTEGQVLVFVATMHGLTDHEAIQLNTEEIVKDYLALGLDPKKVIIFDQKDIRKEVALLKMYLERHLTVARACRVPTLKDKLRQGQKPEEANVLLMNYPVMMAADIFLQDADVVPVGKDQYSHMELMRELADSVNEKYGKDKKILVRAETMNRDEPINILSLNGEGKMSKSKPEGAIFLTDSPEVITKKMKRAETAIEGDMSDKLNNLIKIADALAPEYNKEIESIIARHMSGEKVMGELKKLLTEILINFTKAFQVRRAEITHEQVSIILSEGSVIAKTNANIVLERLEKAMGLI